MLRPWDTTSLHSSFGAVNGLQIGDGDIGPVLDSLDGFIRGAEVWFDVTAYLEGVRTGFRTFLQGMRGGGRVAACADDHGAASLLAATGASGYSYGLSAGSCLRAVDVRAEAGAMSCRIREDGKDVGALFEWAADAFELKDDGGAPDLSDLMVLDPDAGVAAP